MRALSRLAFEKGWTPGEVSAAVMGLAGSP